MPPSNATFQDCIYEGEHVDNLLISFEIVFFDWL